MKKNRNKIRNKIWNKKWFGIRMGLGICAALGWWGLLYPELTLTPDTVKVVYDDPQDETGAQPQVWSFDSSLYRDILNAPPGKITFRSKLLTDFNAILEAFHGGNK